MVDLIVPMALPEMPGGNAHDNRVRRNILGDDCIGADDRTMTNGHAGLDHSAGSDPNIMLNRRFQAIRPGGALQTSVDRMRGKLGLCKLKLMRAEKMRWVGRRANFGVPPDRAKAPKGNVLVD